jgi:tetratricopeptide (TPR) repeat protein
VQLPGAVGSRPAVDHYINLSLELYRAGKYAECIQAAQEALALDPRSDRAYNNICAAYNELGMWDQAIEAGEKAVSINPSSALSRNNLAWARRQRSAKP